MSQLFRTAKGFLLYHSWFEELCQCCLEHCFSLSLQRAEYRNSNSENLFSFSTPGFFFNSSHKKWENEVEMQTVKFASLNPQNVCFNGMLLSPEMHYWFFDWKNDLWIQFLWLVPNKTETFMLYKAKEWTRNAYMMNFPSFLTHTHKYIYKYIYPQFNVFSIQILVVFNFSPRTFPIEMLQNNVH